MEYIDLLFYGRSCVKTIENIAEYPQLGYPIAIVWLSINQRIRYLSNWESKAVGIAPNFEKNILH